MASVMTADLFSRARSGDNGAFGQLTQPHVRELQAHCYRMLGSFQDAEDALQDTLLTAWQGLRGFEQRASLRTWLYRIATNRCLNVIRSASRRPAKAWNVPGLEPPTPTRLGEVPWLEPFPDAIPGHGIDVPPGSEACYEQTQSISLAFVTALQTLPPRQLAVLILRDVLGFEAKEVAGMLESTVESANSALKRARATMKLHSPSSADHQAACVTDARSDDALVAKFVSAYEAGDLDVLVALLTDDVFMSMPPMPLEYIGRDVVTQFLRVIVFGAGRKYTLVPTRANGQPAFGIYVSGPDGIKRGTGLVTLALRNGRICAMSRFENHLLPAFGLPPSLVPSPG